MLTLFFSLLFGSALCASNAEAGVGPAYSNIVRTLQSQPVQNATLVYWDQSAADALGIITPPGRVGNQHFDQAVIKKLAFEIKSGAQPVSPQQNFDEQNHPFIFVEQDSLGGAGRAGYIEVEPGVWVNIKGIGITGAGLTSNSVIGPPSQTFTSHKDGSATFEEAIKETVSGRIADSELSRGGGRVLAIIYTGRTIRYPDGNEVPLALIIRTPLRRFDQDATTLASQRAITESLAEANAKRIFKGDFINQSNLGSMGEFVDYGTMSFTLGYAPLKSSAPASFLKEAANYSFASRSVYAAALGQGLLEQMGIPEAHLLAATTLASSAGETEKIGNTFITSVYWNSPTVPNPETVLDFEHVSKERLEGNVRFHEFFKDAAKNYYSFSGTRDEIFKSELQRLLSLSRNVDSGLVQELSNFLGGVHRILETVATANGLTDRLSYGRKLQLIARFKNRDLENIVRPALFDHAGSLTHNFVNNHDVRPIQTFIEETVLGNRFNTVGVSDSQILVQANSSETNILIRAYTEGDQKKLFQYPELMGSRSQETFSFRVTTDGWQSFKDLPARYIHTGAGDYFRIKIPHGSMPVTDAKLELVPYVREASGNQRWLGEHLNLKGPPILLNERIGLPASFTLKPGVMKTRFDTSISISADDLKVIPDTECEILMQGNP